jgi:predicted GH43/DUF377 family glycosyl hydrolase
MIKVEKYGIILSATEKEFESKGVLNPGIYQEGETLHLLYRAIHINGVSTIGYAETKGPLEIVKRLEKPILRPELHYEKKGVLDARIVKIENTFYITYAAYDGRNTLGALAISKDLIHIQKQGIITPQLNYEEYKNCVTNKKNSRLNPKYLFYYNLFSEIGALEDKFRLLNVKDVVLFPRKINGKFAMLLSIWPGIQIAYFDDFKDLTKEYWTDFFENLIDNIVLDPRSVFEANHMGVGGPPIQTEKGWLLIYYGVKETTTGKSICAKAALLQIDKPECEISRIEEPLFAPTKPWEKKGHADEIVFPTGHAVFDDALYIYYGAADKNIAVAKLSLKELLSELLKKA